MEQSDSVYCYKKRNLKKKVAAENIFRVHFFAKWKSLDKDWNILIVEFNKTTMQLQATNNEENASTNI